MVWGLVDGCGVFVEGWNMNYVDMLKAQLGLSAQGNIAGNNQFQRDSLGTGGNAADNLSGDAGGFQGGAGGFDKSLGGRFGGVIDPLQLG